MEKKDFSVLSESVNNQLGELFHKHLLIKAFVSNPPNDEQFLIDWLRDLVEKINMKVVIGPFAKYVEAVGNAGLTGHVTIETSHAAIHIWNESKPAMIQMDVYSCSCFEAETVISKLKDFGLLSYEKMVIDRNKEFFVTESETKYL